MRSLFASSRHSENMIFCVVTGKYFTRPHFSPVCPLLEQALFLTLGTNVEVPFMKKKKKSSCACRGVCHSSHRVLDWLCGTSAEWRSPFSCDTLLFPVSPHFTRVISYTQKKKVKTFELPLLPWEAAPRCRLTSPPPGGRPTLVGHTHAKIEAQ